MRNIREDLSATISSTVPGPDAIAEYLAVPAA
jgi:hypothetical protein